MSILKTTFAALAVLAGAFPALGQGQTQASTSAPAPVALNIAPVAEKKVHALPPAPFFWRIENLPTLAAAQAAAGEWALAF